LYQRIAKKISEHPDILIGIEAVLKVLIGEYIYAEGIRVDNSITAE
jgi:hypothetical protein